MLEAETHSTLEALPHHRFRIAEANMSFRVLEANKDKLSGREILGISGIGPVEEIALIRARLHRTDIVGLDQEVKIHDEPTFIAFRTPTLHRLIIDQESYVWGSTIAVRALELLSGLDPESEGIWWLRDDGEVFLDANENIDLTPPFVERFRTGSIYWVCLENRKVRWPRATITAEQIAELGGWNVADGVIEVDDDQNERTLQPGEIVVLKPGLSFGKCLCWRRG